VPRNRTDPAYFAPLTGYKLKPETKLYLGLIHYTDGLAGAQARVRAALTAVSHFGVTTECGLGCRSAATVPDLLPLHAQAAQPLN